MVGVVVVGVVEPPETPTKSLTVLPLAKWLPPLGLWRSTLPTSEDSPVTTEETWELRPARSRASSADSSLRPTTVGTATFLAFGASATTRLTFVLARTSVPALGSWLRTLPGDWEEDGWRVTVPLARLAFAIAACAEARLSSTRSGTVMSAGPLETSTVTVLPWRSTVPAGGSVPITTPAGTVATGGVADLRDEAGAVQAGAGLGGVQAVHVGQGDVGGAAGDDDLDGRALACVAARRRGLRDDRAGRHPHAGGERRVRLQPGAAQGEDRGLFGLAHDPRHRDLLVALR